MDAGSRCNYLIFKTLVNDWAKFRAKSPERLEVHCVLPPLVFCKKNISASQDKLLVELSQSNHTYKPHRGLTTGRLKRVFNSFSTRILSSLTKLPIPCIIQ